MFQFFEITGLVLAAFDFFGISRSLEKKIDHFIYKLKVKYFNHSFKDQAIKIKKETSSYIPNITSYLELFNIFIGISAPLGIGGSLWFTWNYCRPDYNNYETTLENSSLFVQGICGIYSIPVIGIIFLLGSPLIIIILVPKIIIISVVMIKYSIYLYSFVIYSMLYVIWSILNILNRPAAGVVGTIGFIIAILGFSLGRLNLR